MSSAIRRSCATCTWRGIFDGGQLIEMIERGEFGIVILRAHFYPPPVLAAIGGHYEHAHTIHMNGFDYSILYPKELDGGEGTPDDNGLPD